MNGGVEVKLSGVGQEGEKQISRGESEVPESCSLLPALTGFHFRVKCDKLRVEAESASPS